MNEAQQESLFPQDIPKPPDFDASAVSKHIAENAPKIDYPERVSEAAADQGWAPRVVRDQPDEAEEAEIDTTASRHPSNFANNKSVGLAGQTSVKAVQPELPEVYTDMRAKLKEGNPSGDQRPTEATSARDRIIKANDERYWASQRG